MKEKDLTNAQLIEMANEMIPYQHHAHIQTLKELISRFEKLAEYDQLLTKTNPMQKQFLKIDRFNIAIDRINLIEDVKKYGPAGEFIDQVGCEIYQDYKSYPCKISAEEVLRRIEKGGIVINCDPE